MLQYGWAFSHNNFMFPFLTQVNPFTSIHKMSFPNPEFGAISNDVESIPKIL
jgi:hypothetical protein